MTALEGQSNDVPVRLEESRVYSIATHIHAFAPYRGGHLHVMLIWSQRSTTEQPAGPSPRPT